MTYARLLGYIVEHHRRRAAINQESMAQALAISQSAYSRLEQGQSAMSVTQLRLIAMHLKMSPAVLVEHAEQYARQLRAQHVEVTHDRQPSDSTAGVLIGLGILAALIAGSRS